MSVVVYPPTEPDQGYTVADNGVWVPGLYDSPETARRACLYLNRDPYQINHVWRYDGENRPATMTDLDGIVRGIPLPPGVED